MRRRVWLLGIPLALALGAWLHVAVFGGSETLTISVAPGPTVDLHVFKAGAATGTVTAPGTGSITGTGINCGTDCQENYEPTGTSVTLTAIPGVGAVFSGWSGPCTGAGTCIVTMSQHRQVTATFLPATGTVLFTTSTARGAIGTGNCQTPTIPGRCTNAYALSLATPGTTISMEGNTIAAPFVYQGANDMLRPPALTSGNQLAPIRVLCEVDGGCLIDAQFVAGRHPIHLSNANQWWEFGGPTGGFNAKNAGSNGVIRVEAGSNNNKFIRMVAWDSPINANTKVVQIWASTGNQFIDLAAFGTGRKVWEPFQGANNTVCRRCWLRMEGSTFGGALAATPFYVATGTIWENVLVTWSGESQPQTYTNGSTNVAHVNFEFGNPPGILATDRIEQNAVPPPKNATIRIRGSIVYIKDTDRLPNSTSGNDWGGRMPLVKLQGASDMVLTDVIAVMSNLHPAFNQHLGFGLTRRNHNCPGNDEFLSANQGCVVNGVVNPDHANFVVVGNNATRVTSVRGTKQFGNNQGDSFGRNGVAGFGNEQDWAVNNRSLGNCVTGSTKNPCGGTKVTTVQTPWQNVSVNGARLCFRTENGVTGTTPLWPWPMNERIKKATAMAGAYAGPCSINCTWPGGVRPPRTETDVTADIEALLGAIPPACKTP